MIVLGIDSAPARTGWAVMFLDLRGSEILLHSGVSGRLDSKEMCEFLKSRNLSVNTIGQFGMAVIEGPYLDKNVRTHEVLARWVGRWEMACELAGIKTEVVKADVWQRGILTGLINRTSRREARKRAARMWVRATFDITVSEDEADAIALATWALRRTRLERKIKSAAR